MARSAAAGISPEDLAAAAPRVPWAAFRVDFGDSWGQGEHLTIIGPTGQGKSVFARAVLKDRARRRGAHIVVFGTKPKDRTLTGWGWPIIRTWPPGYGKDCVIFWPPFGDVTTAASRQRRAIYSVLREIFRDGGRTVYFDEVGYVTEELRLAPMLRQFWQQGRSLGITVVGSTQRPRDVPRAMFSECSWFVAFRTADEDELRRVGEIGGIDSNTIKAVIRSLRPHEFVAVRVRTGEMVISRVERSKGVGAM